MCGIVGILGCLYLFISLPQRTQIFFVVAQVIGVLLYLIYGHRAAEKARSASLTADRASAWNALARAST